MNNSPNLWVDKYNPTKINDIIGNTDTVKTIVKWLVDFDIYKEKALEKATEDLKKTTKSAKSIKKKKIIINDISPENVNELLDGVKIAKKNIREYHNCLLITGNHGIGKTSSLNVILKEYNYEINTVNLANIKNIKNLHRILLTFINSENIIDLFYGNKKKKTAIVIDEIESITSTTEKSCILSLLKLNDKYWYCPIIFISNNQHNKLLSHIKKNSKEIKFKTPTFDDLEFLLNKITTEMNINIFKYNVTYKIIKHSQMDIRRLIYILQDLKYEFNDTLITPELFIKYQKSSKNKDIDFDLFKATDNLIYNYNNINECLEYYKTGKVVLPLMIQQNYINSILVKKTNTCNPIESICAISESLSDGDIIENYIYGEQNWNIHDIHGFYTCIKPSFLLKNKLYNDYPRPKLVYTVDLNQTSTKKINTNNVIKTKNCFKNMNITDFIYMNKILKYLLNNVNMKECIKILRGYNIQLEYLESLLKIDKIKNKIDTKITLTLKQKKEFLMLNKN
jgi:replication factor C subunit 1